MSRHAQVEVDLDAIASNVVALKALAPDAEFCAVVKADAYGHGAERVAPVALEAGASMLGVALVEEGAALRASGIDAPILLLSEPPAESLYEAWNLNLTPTIYHADTMKMANDAVADHGRWGIHIKVDTGMHRVGVSPNELLDLAAMAVASPRLVLEGVFTHMAVADEPQREETEQQIARFVEVLAELHERGIDPGIAHAANSASLLGHPQTHLDLIRAGISIYGVEPAPGLASEVDLKPAMRVSAEVSRIAVVRAGESISYGLRHTFDTDTLVATVPIGYADGISRRLWATGGEVLIGGSRRPIRGVITMDQFMVELGPADSSDAQDVARGDEVVLLGSQRGHSSVETITAWEWADRLRTIAYEVVCGFSPRMPRVYSGG